MFFWETSRKVTQDNAPDDWKKLTTKSIVHRYTEHPGAAMFKAPAAEPQLLDLKFKDRKDREKIYVDLQSAQGAIGAMATKMLMKFQGEHFYVPHYCLHVPFADKNEELGQIVKDFQNPDVVIEDPRTDAVLIIKGVKEALMEKYAKLASDVVKVAGASFSKLLVMRRNQFEVVTGTWKGAKTSLKRLQPSRNFLYGNKVSELCKDLETSSNLSPLSGNRARGRGYGYNPRPGRGGGGNSGGRGATYGSGYSYRGTRGVRGAGGSRRGGSGSRGDKN